MKKNWRFSILILALLPAIWLANDMIQRNKAELLWGYRPLAFFLLVWVVLLLLPPFFSKKESHVRHLLLSSLSGVMLGVGFPDIVPFPFLLFAGFVPLLLVEHEIAQRQEKQRPGLFRYAYNTFVIWNIIATYWVANTAFAAGIAAIWLNALLMMIPFALFHRTRKVMPRLAYAAFMAYWLAFEYIHLNWELTWPWLTLGNGFAEFPMLIQWYEYTGAFGGGLWILLANVLILKMVQAKMAKTSIPRKRILQLTALVLLPAIFSIWLFYTYEEKGTPVEIAIVQPNYEPHYQKFSIPESEQVKQFLQLSATVVDTATDYLVYPESSFGMVATDEINQYEAIRNLREYFKNYTGLNIVTGLNAYYILKPGEPHTDAVRMVERRDGPMYYESLNIAAQIQIGQEDIAIYRKSKPVPGPEIFPYSELLFFFKPLVDKLEGTTEGIGIQKERAVFDSEAGKIAPAICYESVFGEYVTEYIRKGAQAIFIMTNDGWWDNTAGHRQHLYFGALRAIETRRGIARSANTGISAFINQKGVIAQPTQYDEPAAIKGTVLFNDTITFYVRWGDIIARIALFCSIVFLLNVISKRLRVKYSH
ncbi:MAG TPA: apolipoprotein N-acyltransferase [Saprospiraceae bacterium]|nr:apolipoprotein N-acyltransferase [Saprospiraceae bacterium]HMQ82807.1 apolipoprotein N-acyltransferase [Saprospiraceae bacterium]